jgi:hypothetical protein
MALFAAIHAWASGTERLRGSNLLGMFCGVLSVWLVAGSFVIAEPGAFRTATVLIGLAALVVSVYEAWASPGELRRADFGPSAP